MATPRKLWETDVGLRPATYNHVNLCMLSYILENTILGRLCFFVLMNRLTQFALWADKKPRWWIGLCFPFAAVMTLVTAVTPGLPTRGIYKSYYVHMLPRVQTVDFNMLFAMLPAALSNAMAGHHVAEIKNNPSQYRHLSQNIQSILDSNYGVFYLLVTHETIKPSDIESGKEEYILYETKNQGLTDVLDRGYIVHSDLILYPQPACIVKQGKVVLL